MSLTAFFDTAAGQAVLVVGLLAVLDLFLGVAAAIRDDVFKWEALSSWVRSELMGKIVPIFGFLVVGYIAGGLTLDDGINGALSAGTILTGIGLTAAATYVATIFASMRESLVKKPGVRAIPEE